MYHARLKKAFEESGLSQKLLAEKAKVSEKTIKRILDNPDYRADLETMELIAKALNITMWELFSETDVVLVRKEVLAELEESKKFVDECQTLSTENILLRKKVADFEKENEKLLLTIQQKDKIIYIHESYKSTIDRLAQIITGRSTDTQ
jgi:transcriptional regulator with XRE-family HTH domain